VAVALKRENRTRTATQVARILRAAVGYLWAFSALTASPGARAHYDRRRAGGERHTAAQRNLFNRLLGVLHHCLHTGQPYRETTAFPTPKTPPPRPQLDKFRAWDVFIASELGCRSVRPSAQRRRPGTESDCTSSADQEVAAPGSPTPNADRATVPRQTPSLVSSQNATPRFTLQEMP
jgi:hypothetical protein